MGAGKGKTRRGQAVAATGIVVYQPGNWRQFVKDSELSTVKLHQYYLGETPQQLSDADYEKLTGELFADAVNIGAINLHGTHTTTDFVWTVSPGATSYGRLAEVSLKSRPELKENFGFARQELRFNRALGSEQIGSALYHIDRKSTRLNS